MSTCENPASLAVCFHCYLKASLTGVKSPWCTSNTTTTRVCVCVFCCVCVQGCVWPLVSGRRLNNSEASHARRQHALHPLSPFNMCVCVSACAFIFKRVCICMCAGDARLCAWTRVKVCVCAYECMFLWVGEPSSVSGGIVLHNP